MAAVGATSTRASLPGNCPTLFGFEPARRRRIPLALDDHSITGGRGVVTRVQLADRDVFCREALVRLGDETSAGCGSFPGTSCSRSPMQRHAPRRSHRSLNGIAPPANECRAFAESSKMRRYAMRRRPRYD